jgi:T5SS/PEP-CTERM-associated repeat protein
MLKKQIVGKFIFRQSLLPGLMAAAMIIVNAQITLAADDYWDAATADWSDTDPCPWSLGVEPTSGDNAYIANGGTANVTQAEETCANLYLGGADAGTVSIAAPGVFRITSSIFVGNTGLGMLNHSAGINSIHDSLYLGYDSAANGTYNFSGLGSVQATTAYVGHSGAGTFNQSAPSPAKTEFRDLYLGYNIGSTGTYNLTGTSSLTASRSQYVGHSGVGSFYHSAGTNTVNSDYTLSGLYLGYNSGASGTYTLTGTGTLKSPYVYIGYSGTGTFNQFGGTNTIHYLSPLWEYYGTLILGCSSGSSGTYCLTGGQLNADRQFIGGAGAGSFFHTAGINEAKVLYLGYDAGVSGTYELNGTGTLETGGEYVGYSGTGTINHTAGSNSISVLILPGPYFLPAATGRLSLGYNAGASGTYNLSGAGRITSAGEAVGESGDGVFNQSGGTNDAGNLYLAYNPGSSGTYNLTGGTLVVKQISKGGGNAAFNFGDATLKAKDNFSTTMPMTLTGIGGNAKVDPANYQVTFSGPLVGPGGLNMLGWGKLTLDAINAYQGQTTILKGTLALSAVGTIDSSPIINVLSPGIFDVYAKNASGGFQLSDSQTLTGNGSVAGNVVAAAGSHIAPGNSLGTLRWVTGDLILNNGARLDFELGASPISDKILMSNIYSTLFLNDQQFTDFNFSPVSGFDKGDYTLIESYSISGNLGENVSGAIAGRPAWLSISFNNLVLHVVPEPGACVLLATAFTAWCALFRIRRLCR